MGGNPFRPGFGRMPDPLIGREAVLARFREALAVGGGIHFLVSGHRGMGKTVLLQACGDEAQQAGWHVLSEYAEPGVTASLTDSWIPKLLRELDGGKDRKRTPTAINIAGLGGVTTTVEENYPTVPKLEMRIAELIDKAEEVNPRGHQPVGVLLTLDEIESASMSDVRQIAHAMQRLTGEGLPVIFVGATLSHNVPELMNLPRTTFIRRATMVNLGPLERAVVADVLRSQFEKSRRMLGQSALDLAAGLTGQHPYLLQVVGSALWEATRPGPVNAEMVRDVLPQIDALAEETLYKPALMSLSAREADFLEAMATIKQPAHVAGISSVLGVTRQWGHELRGNLERQGLLERDPDGRVRFTIPFMADYITDHGAHYRNEHAATPVASRESLISAAFADSRDGDETAAEVKADTQRKPEEEV